jgi:hypothetical protein
VHQLLGFGWLLQLIKRRHALAGDRQRRRGAIKGQAIPGRKLQYLQFTCKKRHCIGQHPHFGIVGSNKQRSAFCGACQIRE